MNLSRITPAIVRGVGERLWETVNVIAFLDSRGCLWVFTFGLRTDLYSSPRLLWFFRPPSNGVADVASILHDALVRCRNRLGIGLIDCHKIFREAMKECGVGRVRRNLKYAAVYAFNWICAGAGDGTTGQAKYDQPVGPNKEPLASWVRAHYAPDGKGYKKADGADYFFAVKTGETECEIVDLELAD